MSDPEEEGGGPRILYTPNKVITAEAHTYSKRKSCLSFRINIDVPTKHKEEGQFPHMPITFHTFPHSQYRPTPLAHIKTTRSSKCNTIKSHLFSFYFTFPLSSTLSLSI